MSINTNYHKSFSHHFDVDTPKPSLLIEKHPAWKGIMDQSTADSLLKGRDVYTYILYKDSESDQYTISYVDIGGTIEHRNYHQESDKGWGYRNLLATKAANINDLVSHMMHCKPKMCKPLE